MPKSTISVLSSKSLQIAFKHSADGDKWREMNALLQLIDTRLLERVSALHRDVVMRGVASENNRNKAQKRLQPHC